MVELFAIIIIGAVFLLITGFILWLATPFFIASGWIAALISLVKDEVKLRQPLPPSDIDTK